MINMKAFVKNVMKNKVYLLMLLPGVIWFILFSYVPMFGISVAFKDFDYAKGIFHSDWIGFKNFEFLFKAKDAFIILRNTLLYNIVWIPLTIFTAVAFAVMYDAIGKRKVRRWAKGTQTLSLMPYFLSWIVISYFVTALLDFDKGVINKWLISLGREPVNWYFEPSKWPVILTIAHIWKGVGYSSIIYYSTIRGFSPEYYEAAWLDGANWYQQLRHITLPLLKPTITIMFILAIGSILSSDFGLFYFVPKNSGMLYSTTSTLDTYIYNGMTAGGDYALTGAANFLKSVTGFVLVLVTNSIVRKISPDNSLF